MLCKSNMAVALWNGRGALLAISCGLFNSVILWRAGPQGLITLDKSQSTAAASAGKTKGRLDNAAEFIVAGIDDIANWARRVSTFSMNEEDQESHFDDPDEQEEPIKVSVTFKPPEPENKDVKLTDNSKDKALDDKSGDPQQVNDTCCDSDTEESYLPSNPPVTPISSCLDPKKASSERHEAEQPEVLEGWKGYSNNIYIQPIVVNHASSDTCLCPTNQKPQRRLTNEDLRKQMRLREANGWITKHNERIRSTGTLRTRVQFNEKQNREAVKELPEQTKDKDKTKPKQSKAKSKLHKGFVCRTWATNFLPKDDIEDEEEEYSPFFVWKYVDNSKSSSAVTKKVPTKISEEKRKISQLTSTQKDSKEHIEPSTNESVHSIEIKLLKEKAWVDENNNEKTERCIKITRDNFQSLQNISHGICCCCGEGLSHNKEMRRSQSTLLSTKHFHQERSRTFKETDCVTLPIKQFPPINPLEGLKKRNIPASTRRGVLPPRRPHTVDTAILSKEAILVNGHHNLPNYIKTSGSLSKLYRERGSTFSLENFNKEKNVYSRVQFEKNWDGSKHFDESINLLSSRTEADRRGSETLDKSAKPRCTLHEERNNQGMRGRYRSISDPRGNAKPWRIIFDKNANVLCGNTRNRLLLRTPPYSLNSEDNDSNTDSNDTGLGSEIEYTFDGSAKLDIYLQPRGASCH